MPPLSTSGLGFISNANPGTYRLQFIPLSENIYIKSFFSNMIHIILTFLSFWRTFLFSSIACFNWIHLNFKKERKYNDFSVVTIRKLFKKIIQSLSRQGHWLLLRIMFKNPHVKTFVPIALDDPRGAPRPWAGKPGSEMSGTWGLSLLSLKWGGALGSKTPPQLYSSQGQGTGHETQLTPTTAV